jgi:hypothetical protein
MAERKCALEAQSTFEGPITLGGLVMNMDPQGLVIYAKKQLVPGIEPGSPEVGD